MEILSTSLFLFAFSAAFTPGPNNIMIMSSGLNFGIRPSLPHLFGICFGFPSMFIAIGFGLGYVFELYPWLHRAIKIFGITYLIYLSWLIATATTSASITSRSKPFSFFQAALFQWVNPKAWIMGTSALATFTTGGENIYQQVFVLALVFFIFAFPSSGSWLLLGQSLKRIISNPLQQRAFNISMALLLVGSIVPIAYEMIQ